MYLFHLFLEDQANDQNYAGILLYLGHKFKLTRYSFRKMVFTFLNHITYYHTLDYYARLINRETQ